MPILIPSLISCQSGMTSGEKRLAQRLIHKLGSECLLWYNVPIGPKRLHPDFIILHPSRGLLILEVKDWKLDTLRELTSTWVTIHTENGNKKVENPLEQARKYALAVCKLLERDAALVQPLGSPHQGKLIFPYGYGAVFTNISRKQFDASDLGKFFPPHLVICKDEMTESVDAESFQERLWRFLPYSFGQELTQEQINRVRWHIFPEMRITEKQLELFTETTSEESEEIVAPVQLTPDLIQIMDLQQEQLARSFGEGHRVIHGVAGAGKTLILAHRCQYLAQKHSKPILVLCFNVALASWLRRLIQKKHLTACVTIRHFHGWCNDLLKQYKVVMPNRNKYEGSSYVQALVEQVIRAVDKGQIPTGQYGAVLLDEGHDFEPEWLKLVVQMVDPDTASLLLLYDDAQKLYGKNRKQRFSFSSVGIKAQGRTTILKINYRNTAEVLTLASEFPKQVITSTEVEEEDTPIRVPPQSAGRRGSTPDLVHLPNFDEEVNYITQRVQQLFEREISWHEIAILYRYKWMGEKIYQQLVDKEIPVDWVNKSFSSRSFQPDENTIKLMTMHSSKGLEFPVVFIPGLGFLPHEQSSPQDEEQLLYVAMTRSTCHLTLTYNRASNFVNRIRAALESISKMAC